MVSLLCTSRSGSTNLSYYLSKVLEMKFIQSPFSVERGLSYLKKGNFYKLFIHHQPISYDNLFGYGERIVKISDKTILYDRRSKIEQSVSLAFKKRKYGKNFNLYHIREVYDFKKLNVKQIQECQEHFENHSKALTDISEKYNLPIFYYEDIFYGDGLQKLSDYLEIDINKDLQKKYLDTSLKTRLFSENLKETLI